MVSTGFFIFIAILAILLLIAAAVIASIGAADINSSALSQAPDAQIAYKWLIIAAVIGFCSLAVLLIVLAIGWWTGAFTVSDIADNIKSKTVISHNDVLELHKEKIQLRSSGITQGIIITAMILILLAVLTLGIFGSLAAIQLFNLPTKDNNANMAYIMSIVTAVLGVGGAGLLFIALLTYIGIRYRQSETLKNIDELEKKGLVTPTPVVAAPVVTTPVVTPPPIVATPPTITLTPDQIAKLGLTREQLMTVGISA